MDKKSLVLWVFLVVSVAATGQPYDLGGKVVNAKTLEKVEFVAILVKEVNLWTTSDINGDFIIRNIPKGSYTLQASCLGYEKYEKPITIERDVVNFRLELVPTSLALTEVVIVAKENTSLTSSSKIEGVALEHVQPTSLADVMQLVPGQITLNPNMSNANQIAIRDINRYSGTAKTYAARPDNNSAMGTAVIVDGTPSTNNANMQTLNTATGGTSQGYSTAGQGIDLRQVPTDNIESIEVIRGIPSAEYGDLTTGAILVKTKAGKTKLLAKIRSDAQIKQYALSKGFLLPGNNFGAVNLDGDFTQSMDDLRDPLSTFKRITGQVGYSNTLMRNSTPLSINLKATYYSTFDNEKSDPDMLKEEIYNSDESSMGVKLYGSWSLNKKALTNITYNFSSNFDRQKYYQYKVTSGSAMPQPISMVEGESVGAILPSSYFSELTIDGKPYNYFAMIKGSLVKEYGELINNLMLGTDWRISGNKGDGRIYDITRPPTGASSTRPRAFKDIPASKELSIFLEDKIIIPIGKTHLNFQGGVRYTNLLPKGLFTTDGYMVYEPRVNFTYEILKNRRKAVIRDLSLRGGYGKTSKTPGMIYLYPDMSYEDELSFNYYPDLIVVSTAIKTSTNPDLKPTTNIKLEGGLDIDILGKKLMVTAFSEKLRDGFSWDSRYFPMEFRVWKTLEGAGKNPVFENGNIYYTENGERKILEYTMAKQLRSYSYPLNNYSIDKKGVEYLLNLGKIPFLKSSLMLDGAYYNIRKIDEVNPYMVYKDIIYLGSRYNYLALFPGNSGTVRQRLNTNIKIDTHIPSLKMITSLTGMIIWFEKTNYYWKDEDLRNYAYSLGPNNERIYGDYDKVDKIYVDPIGYYDIDMNYHPWESSMSFENPTFFMIRTLKNNYYTEEVDPISWQINLKLTKEIGEIAKISFFANNLFNQRPLYKNPRTQSYYRLNQQSYFGAEIKLTL